MILLQAITSVGFATFNGFKLETFRRNISVYRIIYDYKLLRLLCLLNCHFCKDTMLHLRASLN